MSIADEALTECTLFNMDCGYGVINVSEPWEFGKTFPLLKAWASWVFLNNWPVCARTVNPSFLLSVFTAWDHAPIDTSYQDWLTPSPVPYITSLMRLQVVAAVHVTASEWSWPPDPKFTVCVCVVFLSFLHSLTAPSKVYRIQLHWKQHASQ